MVMLCEQQCSKKLSNEQTYKVNHTKMQHHDLMSSFQDDQNEDDAYNIKLWATISAMLGVWCQEAGMQEFLVSKTIH